MRLKIDHPKLSLLPLQSLHLDIFNKHIEVVCNHPRVYKVFKSNFSAFISSKNLQSNNIDLFYEADFDDSSNLYSLFITEDMVLRTPLVGKFLYWIEKEITITLQKMRPDLYFLHAAALELDGTAFIVTGQAGAGKSTLTWALVNNNFGYMSDELAPLDMQTMMVQPFPHALCLKTEPAAPYTFPATVVSTERASHIPASDTNIKLVTQPLPLKAIFFIQHDTESAAPTFRKLPKPEAALRLYTNTLNALAHEKAGLNAATTVVSKTECYELITTDLSASCALIKQCLDTEA